MTPKTKRILLIAISAAAVFLAALVCLLLLKPWAPSRDWQKIDRLSDYEGLLDSPISEITLYSPGSHPYYQVTFSDEDLIALWSDYLHQVEVQAVEQDDSQSLHILGTPSPQITVKTALGEYTLRFCLGRHQTVPGSGEATPEYREWEDGNYRLQHDGWYYTLSDPEGFPFEETYEIAAQRHGETGPG